MPNDLQTPQQQLADAEARLVEMLHAVRLERPVPSGTQAPVRKTGCPECGSETDWGAGSWCPDCGYYPKLGRTVDAGIREAETEEALPDFDLASLAWVAVFSVGLVLVLAESIASLYLVPELSERALWGRMQLVLGVVVFATGQFFAYLLAAQKTDAVPLTAFFSEPFLLWKTVCQRLPDSRRVLYLGGWGGLAAVLAFGVIGLDFEGMFSGLKKSRKGPNVLKSIVKAAAATEGSAFSASGEEEEEAELADEEESLGENGPAGGNGNGGEDLEGSMKSLAGATGADSIGEGRRRGNRGTGKSADFQKSLASVADSAHEATQKPVAMMAKGKEKAPKKIPLTANGEERLEQQDFLIFGYLTNAAGEIRSVLLANVEGNRPRFAGRFSIDTLSPKEGLELQQVLDQFRTAHAMMPAPYRARWVRPVIACRIAFTGWTPEGRPKDGYLVSYELRTEPADSTPEQVSAR